MSELISDPVLLTPWKIGWKFRRDPIEPKLAKPASSY